MLKKIEKRKRKEPREKSSGNSILICRGRILKVSSYKKKQPKIF
jgi:hypothetical protein